MDKSLWRSRAPLVVINDFSAVLCLVWFVFVGRVCYGSFGVSNAIFFIVAWRFVRWHAFVELLLRVFMIVWIFVVVFVSCLIIMDITQFIQRLLTVQLIILLLAFY